ncbi:hypothetical protein [Oryzibacter oryziterrae]|uniref:hypothetical protein n=1 Tax=Oryzibacter oryziterrae TaxID=2766474 RepID=UPI001F3F2CC7|nr:hypothetical protein [Oryzibacter oryziterrae]
MNTSVHQAILYLDGHQQLRLLPQPGIDELTWILDSNLRIILELCQIEPSNFNSSDFYLYFGNDRYGALICIFRKRNISDTGLNIIGKVVGFSLSKDFSDILFSFLTGGSDFWHSQTERNDGHSRRSPFFVLSEFQKSLTWYIKRRSLNFELFEACISAVDVLSYRRSICKVIVVGGDIEERFRVAVELMNLMRSSFPRMTFGLLTSYDMDVDLGTDLTVMCCEIPPINTSQAILIPLDPPKGKRLRVPSVSPSPKGTVVRPGRSPSAGLPERAPPMDQATPIQSTSTPSFQGGGSIEGQGRQPAETSSPTPVPVASAPVAPEECAAALLHLAFRICSRRTSPAPLIQAIQDRLGPLGAEQVRRVFEVALRVSYDNAEAAALTMGGIQSTFEGILSSDAKLEEATFKAFESWPPSARVLYTSRLLRGRSNSEALGERLLGLVGGLIDFCAGFNDLDGTPIDMRFGFLQSAAASGRLPDEIRDRAAVSADRLSLRGDRIAPSTLLRVLARSGAAAEGTSPLARAYAIVELTGVAPALADPMLVHLAALMLSHETGVDVATAFGIIQDAASRSSGWTVGRELERAFASALELHDDGFVCRRLLPRSAVGEVELRPSEDVDDAPLDLSEVGMVVSGFDVETVQSTDVSYSGPAADSEADQTGLQESLASVQAPVVQSSGDVATDANLGIVDTEPSVKASNAQASEPAKNRWLKSVGRILGKKD